MANPWLPTAPSAPTAPKTLIKQPPGGGAWGGQQVPKRSAAPGGAILSRPGQREQFYDPADYTTPGFGETFGQQAVTQGQAQMGPQNVANQYFQQYQQQIGQDPGLGAYYDRAKARTSADINQQLASRGAYGSSVGLGMVGEALGGLEAQRAKEEADYMLQQQGLGGQLAGQAASSMLGWTQGLGGLGLGTDAAQRARMGLGIQGATAADAGMLDRGSMISDIAYRNAQLAMAGIGGAQAEALAADQATFDAAMAAKYGLGTEGYNQAQQAGQRQQEDIGMLGSIAGSFFGGIL